MSKTTKTIKISGTNISIIEDLETGHVTIDGFGSIIYFPKNNIGRQGLAGWLANKLQNPRNVTFTNFKFIGV